MITPETIAAAPKDAPVPEGWVRSGIWLSAGTWFCRRRPGLREPTTTRETFEAWIDEVLASGKRLPIAEPSTCVDTVNIPGLRLFVSQKRLVHIKEEQARLLDGYQLSYIEHDDMVIGMENGIVVVGVQAVEIVARSRTTTQTVN